MNPSADTSDNHDSHDSPLPTQPDDLAHEDQRFQQYMMLGEEARRAGLTDQAHQLWKRAATINPLSEMVWLALLELLDSIEDRRVCLRNILAINPTNRAARNKLDALTREDMA